jgi:hypothetical protein
MKSKLIALATAGLLAGTMVAAAQQGTNRSNEGNSDSSKNSAMPNRNNVQKGPMNRGGTTGQNSNPLHDPRPNQPGGISPSAPPQGQGGEGSAYGRPK